MELHVNNLLKFSTLLLLYHRPRHGYQLMKCLQEKCGLHAGPGQIYPFLSLLKKKGLVKVAASAVRDKKTYALTPKGKKVCEKLFARFSSLMEVGLKRDLKECEHCGCELYKSGVKKKIGSKTAVFCCESCAGAYRK